MAKAEQFWDKMAEKYARSKISDEASYQKKLTQTQSLLKPDMRVLEFGCGTGTTAVHHAPFVQHIDATDISEKMLEIGRGRANEAGVDNISFTRGTLAEFGAADASYDVVLGLNIIHLLPERDALLTEVSRVLKPGGLFINSTACLGGTYLRFITLLVPLGKMLGRMPDIYVMTAEELANDIRRAGFNIEDEWQHGSVAPTTFMVARKQA